MRTVFTNTTFLLIVLAVVLASCQSSPPQWPRADAVQWEPYTRADIGWSVETPTTFQPDQVGDDTVFRYHGFPIFRVLFVDDAAARQRGLWAQSRPIGAVTIDGRPAAAYSYDHEDFFTYTHTLAYVLPYQGKQLGIEFRTEGENLDATQQRILSSFRMTGH